MRLANKFKNISVLLIIPFILTGCTLLQSKDKSTQTNVESNETETKESASGDSFTGSYSDILKMNKNMKCNYSYNSEDNQITGTTYVAGKKLKGEGTITASLNNSNVSYNTFMVSDGETLYMWGSNSPLGSKIPLDTFEDSDNSASSLPDKAKEQLQDFNSEMNYNCEPWTVDETFFEVPKNINFVDFSEHLQKLNIDMDACKACNSIPNATAKQECLKKLSC